VHGLPIEQFLFLRRPFAAGFIVARMDIRTLLPELVTRRTTNNDSMSGPDPGHERLSLTNRSIPRFVPRSPTPNYLDGTMHNPAKGALPLR
jgi:hypothetical protein